MPVELPGTHGLSSYSTRGLCCGSCFTQAVPSGTRRPGPSGRANTGPIGAGDLSPAPQGPWPPAPSPAQPARVFFPVEAAWEGDGQCPAGPSAGEAVGGQGLNQRVAPAALVTTPVPKGSAPPQRPVEALAA